MYYNYHWIKDKVKKDLDGEIPAIYIISSNRSSGKTTGGLSLMLDDFKENGKKFALFFRYRYELSSANNLFDDVLAIYKDYGKEITIKSHAQGLFYELFLDEKSCGFAISLSNPDALKKYSPFFREVSNVFMDEFSTENGRYLQDEISKFQSILMTIARGGGEQSRNLRVIMCSNFISILNPYFIAFGIHKRVNKKTHFLRGHGWIAHFDYNKSASDSIKNNRLFAAFSNSFYMEYSTENVYLNDDLQFVDCVSGKFKRVAVIRSDNFDIVVEHFFEKNVVHCRRCNRQNDKVIFSTHNSNHDKNTTLLDSNTWLCKSLLTFYKRGYLRFSDIEVKNEIFDILGLAFFDKK